MGQLLGSKFRTQNMRNATVDLRKAFCLLVYIEICQLHTLYSEVNGECNTGGSDKSDEHKILE